MASFARLLSAIWVLALCACVEVQTDGPVQPKPDWREAAKANTALGIEYARSGKTEAGLEKLRKAIEQDDRYAPAHAALGPILASLGQRDEAITHFQRALSLDPKDDNTRHNYALLLCQMGEYRTALEDLAQVTTNPLYAGGFKAQVDAGQCARRAGKLDDADRLLREALQRDPGQPDALLQMAAVAADRKDWMRVRAFLQRRAARAPDNAETFALAIQAESALGDTEAADRLRRLRQQQFPEAVDVSSPAP